MDRLYDKLISYSKEDYYPMHMPGHKQNQKLLSMGNPYAIDITEIEGFDNLHHPDSILKSLSERISRLYGSVKSYPLINGSTGGILAGISAATNRGDKILISRNSHKSVYHGVVLMGLKPIYCYPQQVQEMTLHGGILASDIEQALITHRDIKLVVITSPTYEGIVSDIRAIVAITHRYGALLMVDEAHGAHFGFHKFFPQSAVWQGADLIIQSLHKTLPSFTQTAVLHSNLPELHYKLEQYLSIYQSSSPSYVLLAGIDRCISILEDQADTLFHLYYERLTQFYRSLEELKHLKLMNKSYVGKYGIYDIDPSKITISVRDTSLTGHRLQELLREEYHIVMEMEAIDYVLGMTSICDTEEGLERLSEAIRSIDSNVVISKNEQNTRMEVVPIPVQEILPQKAMEQDVETIKLQNSVGRISAAFLCPFPPGSPLIVPGERINQEIIEYIHRQVQSKIAVTGLSGEYKDEIEVIL